MDLNKVELIGRLTADPVTGAGDKAALRITLRIATNRRHSGPSGKTGQQAEYHSVIMFGKLAQVAAKYLRKGDRLFVAGRLQTQVWKTRDGGRRSKTEIVGDNLIMLGGKPKADNRNDAVVDEVVDVDKNGEG